MKKKIKIVDPRNNDQDPQEVIDSVLKIWMNSSADEKNSELVRRYKMAGFRVLTLSQISSEQDIPSGSVVFTYQDDPSDLCYYKQGSEVFAVHMGSFLSESVDEEDGTLEELLGLRFGDDSYEDLIIAVSPA